MNQQLAASVTASDIEPVQKRWYTCAEVAKMLGFGESKVRMLVIQGDLRSLKDGRLRRILPEWVDEYVEMRARQAIDAAS